MPHDAYVADWQILRELTRIIARSPRRSPEAAVSGGIPREIRPLDQPVALSEPTPVDSDRRAHMGADDHHNAEA